MNLLPLINRLEDERVGTIGKDLFVNSLPSKVKKGVMLRNKLTGTPINHEIPGYYLSDFQVLVRSHDYQEGEQLIKSVVAALTLHETQVGSTFYRYLRPDTMPVVFPLSDGNILEFSVRMSACFME